MLKNNVKIRGKIWSSVSELSDEQLNKVIG